MTSRLPPLPIVAAALAVLAFAGCSLLPAPTPDRTRHFLVSSASPAAAAPDAVSLGLRRVDVPSYLRGKAMVVRSGTNETRFLPEARWAEPLEEGLARAVRDRLASSAAVRVHPWPVSAERDFDVSIFVTAAEGGDAGVRFAATFEVARAADGAVVARRAFAAPAGSWGGDPAQLAAQLSAGAAALADEILAALPGR